MSKAMTFEGVGDLRFLQYCFLEVLRLDPPVPMSSFACMTEALTIQGLLLDAHQPFVIDNRSLHVNPTQWQQPESFLPERFDPQSYLYKAPGGGKRHPCSFAPFLGGKRVCLGKTFAETAAKYV